MKPLMPATAMPPKFSTWAAGVMKITGMSDMEKIKQLYKEEFLDGETFMNDLYVVIKTKVMTGTHLSIRRLDRKACRDWRHFQAIKNQLCGPECEAVEIYPAESRLVDTANQYHLWVLPEGKCVMAGYFVGRYVTGPEEAQALGAVQRGFEDEK